MGATAMDTMPEMMLKALEVILPPGQIGDRVVNMTCGVAERMEERMWKEEVESELQARDGYGSSCDCFGGIVGALAGFAALAGLVAFAIAQANGGGGRRRRSLDVSEGGIDGLDDELRSLEVNGGSLRSLDPPEISVVLKESSQGRSWTMSGRGTHLTHSLLELLTSEEDRQCLTHQLCKLNRDAERQGDPYGTLIQLAR
ncbi:hypothetical protein FJT64_006922 [Amphibalanus amphitrite]|uniref:Uncharacterized protein n=1 Tax=Amphibalanus amphitrite TaxID=1232801 RepID=A0A6A4VRN1_AMPAM|nr:hypothetical protein FJT64_006922 [Amphibalanus amphitrite]